MACGGGVMNAYYISIVAAHDRAYTLQCVIFIDLCQLLGVRE
jgi:hypothetical protein